MLIIPIQVFNGVPDGRVYNGRLVTVIPGIFFIIGSLVGIQ